jgi:hypothetical protein
MRLETARCLPAALNRSFQGERLVAGERSRRITFRPHVQHLVDRFPASEQIVVAAARRAVTFPWFHRFFLCSRRHITNGVSKWESCREGRHEFRPLILDIAHLSLVVACVCWLAASCQRRLASGFWKR